MTLLLDTANISGAQACGYDREHDINSDDRLRLFHELGGWTLSRGRVVEELTDEAFEDVIGGELVLNDLHLTREERRALDDARWEVIGRQGQEARKQAFKAMGAAA